MRVYWSNAITIGRADIGGPMFSQNFITTGGGPMSGLRRRP